MIFSEWLQEQLKSRRLTGAESPLMIPDFCGRVCNWTSLSDLLMSALNEPFKGIGAVEPPGSWESQWHRYPTCVGLPPYIRPSTMQD